MRDDLVPNLKQAASNEVDSAINKYLGELRRLMNIKDLTTWLPELPIFDGKGIWKRMNATPWGITIYVPWKADTIEATIQAFLDAGWEVNDIPEPQEGYNFVDVLAHNRKAEERTGAYYGVTLRIYAEIKLEDNPDAAMQQGCIVETQLVEAQTYQTAQYHIRCKEDPLDGLRKQVSQSE